MTAFPESLQGRRVELVLIDYTATVGLSLTEDLIVVSDEVSSFDRRRLEVLLSLAAEVS
jgi:hypothetical protein